MHLPRPTTKSAKLALMGYLLIPLSFIAYRAYMQTGTKLPSPFGGVGKLIGYPDSTSIVPVKEPQPDTPSTVATQPSPQPEPEPDPHPKKSQSNYVATAPPKPNPPTEVPTAADPPSQSSPPSPPDTKEPNPPKEDAKPPTPPKEEGEEEHDKPPIDVIDKPQQIVSNI